VPTLIDNGPDTTTAPDPAATERIEASVGGELKLLQGDWEVVSTEQGGEKRTAGFGENGFGSGLLLIKGNTFSMTGQNSNGRQVEGESGLIEIGSGTDPKSIDLISPNNPEDRLVGIYEIKDGTLRICWVEQSNIDVAEGKPVERPTTFESPAGSMQVVIECRRAVDQDPDLEQLQGDWEALSVTEGGNKELPSDKDMSMLLRITDDTLTRVGVMPDGKKVEMQWGSIVLDSSTKPKSIDIVSRQLDDRLLGIYEIEGNTLRICFAEQSNGDAEEGRPAERPKAMESPKGSNIVLIELRKQPVEEAALPVDLKPLQGVWQITRSVRNDEPVVTNDQAFIEIKGDSFMVLELEDGDKLEPMTRLTASVDASKTPATIDLFDEKGKQAFQGIYRVNDDGLLLCLAESRKTTQRPAGFEPPVGDHARLFELKAVRHHEAAPKDAAE